MTSLLQIQEVLQKKQQYLTQFEEATQQMLFCPIEQLEDLVSERQRLIEKMDDLEKNLDALCRENADQVLLSLILTGKGDAGEIPERLQPIYEEAIKIRTVASRLRQSDRQASLRLKTEQKRVLKKIKEMNQGANAKAARFYSNAGTAESRSRLGNA